MLLLPISTRRTFIYCEKLKLGDKPSLSDRVINKASSSWAELEKAEGGWRKRLVTLGNQVFKRIPFEEWGLKSLPSLSKATMEIAGPTSVLFPSRFLQPSAVMGLMHKLATEREAFHKKKMVYSIAAMPVMLPIGLIPVSVNTLKRARRVG